MYSFLKNKSIGIAERITITMPQPIFRFIIRYTPAAIISAAMKNFMYLFILNLKNAKIDFPF